MGERRRVTRVEMRGVGFMVGMGWYGCLVVLELRRTLLDVGGRSRTLDVEVGVEDVDGDGNQLLRKNEQMWITIILERHMFLVPECSLDGDALTLTFQG
ncbi:unnamed protein product [Zymoseptoria tritici ST99CH_3D1]|nr:unnamed protein product [Zymoseptoria tritici ST99CH_3D1]